MLLFYTLALKHAFLTSVLSVSMTFTMWISSGYTIRISSVVMGKQVSTEPSKPTKSSSGFQTVSEKVEAEHVSVTSKMVHFHENRRTADECAAHKDENAVYRENGDVYQGIFAYLQIYCIF